MSLNRKRERAKLSAHPALRAAGRLIVGDCASAARGVSIGDVDRRADRALEIARAAVTLQHRIFLFRAASGAKVMAGCSLALGRLEKVGELLPLKFNELVSGVVFRLRLRLCKLLAKNIVFALERGNFFLQFHQVLRRLDKCEACRAKFLSQFGCRGLYFRVAISADKFAEHIQRSVCSAECCGEHIDVPGHGDPLGGGFSGCGDHDSTAGRDSHPFTREGA